MELLKEKILSEGTVKPGNVLKVDSFLNHQMDINLFNAMGETFKQLFKDTKITKILTIEASGIGIACIVAQYFNVPVIFAKKSETLNIDGDVYTSKVHSFTHQKEYQIRVSKKYLNEEDTVLVIDDFLAKGKALKGLIDIINQSGAKLSGCGIAIEKGFQGGGDELRSKGIRVESLAIVDEMTDTNLTFRK
ncbi:MAG: xanthine phosphoribosyltransferase [Cellulosilyticaceae bacterium]